MRAAIGLRAGAALLAAAVAVADVRGQGFESAVPGDALFFVGIDDVSAYMTSAKASAGGRFVADPACDSARAFFVQCVENLGAKAQEEAGVDPFTLFEMLEGPAAVALLDVLDPETTDLTIQKVPMALVLLLGVGQRGQEFLDAVDKLFEQAVTDGKLLRRSEMEGDVEVFVLVHKEEGEDATEIRYCLSGETFVLNVVSEILADKGWLGDVLAGLRGEIDDPLAESERFVRSVAGPAGDGVRLWLDAGTIADRMIACMDAAGQLDEDDKRWIDGLGVADLDVMDARTTSFEDHTASEAWLRAAGQGHILRIAEAFLADGSPELLGLVPDTSTSAFQVNLDVGAGYDAVVDMLVEMGVESPENIAMQMDAAKTELGFDPRVDVIDNLSGSIALFQAPVQDESEMFFLTPDPENPFNYVLMAGLKDGAKMTALIDTTLQQGGLHAARKREEFMGHTMYSVPVMGMGSVHYAVLDDLLAVTMSAELLQDVMRRRGASDLPSLRTQPDVASSLEQLGAEQSLFVVSDTATAIQGMLKAVDMELQRAKASGDLVQEPWMPPLDELVLPDPAVVEKYFTRPSVSTMRLGPGGFQFQSIGP